MNLKLLTAQFQTMRRQRSSRCRLKMKLLYKTKIKFVYETYRKKVIHGTYMYKIVIYNVSIPRLFLFYFVFMSRLIFGQHDFQRKRLCMTIVERVSQLCRTSVQLILQSGVPIQKHSHRIQNCRRHKRDSGLPQSTLIC